MTFTELHAVFSYLAAETERNRENQRERKRVRKKEAGEIWYMYIGSYLFMFH